MTIEPEPIPLLAPFFSGEGGYCHLLKVLLTAETPLARAFRRAFCEKVLQPKLRVHIGEAHLRVLSEVTVHRRGEVKQAIDLVIYLGNDVVGLEVKVFASSARKGQLNAQYRGLRDKTPTNKNVHTLLISPMPTARHTEVKLEREGDRAGSVTWDEVFVCFPPVSCIESDVLLGALIKQAVDQFKVIRKRAPKTVMTAERLVVMTELEKAVVLFNNTLRDNGGSLRGCSWKPHFWRDPRVDSYYGPLTASDGNPREGQNLVLEAHYEEDSTLVSKDGIRMTVGFRLERKGGVKTYRTEFEARRQECMSELPPPIGQRGCDEGGSRVFDEVWIKVHGKEVPELAGRPLSTALADMLFAYSGVFSDFLLRNGRPVRKASHMTVAD